jgi:hypothetical protein
MIMVIHASFKVQLLFAFMYNIHLLIRIDLISKMPKCCEDIKSAAVKTRTFTNLSTPVPDILKKL